VRGLKASIRCRPCRSAAAPLSGDAHARGRPGTFLSGGAKSGWSRFGERDPGSQCPGAQSAIPAICNGMGVGWVAIGAVLGGRFTATPGTEVNGELRPQWFVGCIGHLPWCFLASRMDSLLASP
jgi:hypothetical protein